MFQDRRPEVGVLAFTLSMAFILSAASLCRADEIEVGKKLFESKCARCHGKDGKGSVKMDKVLKEDIKKIDLTSRNAVQLSAYDIESIMDKGKHKMPKYRGKLTDIQIHSIAQYIKMLQEETGTKEIESPK